MLKTNQYNELGVAKNAPLEVIRAAFKTLTQKHHPDKNPGDKNATETMKRINEAYEVLSNKDKRAALDQYLETEEAQKLQELLLKAKAQATAEAQAKAAAEAHEKAQAQAAAEARVNAEAQAAAEAQARAQKQKSSELKPRQPSSKQNTSVLKFFADAPFRLSDLMWRHKILTTIISLIISLWLIGAENSSEANAVSAAKPTDPMCVAMPNTPQGSHWPDVASEIKLANLVTNTGGSKVIIDNSNGSSAVFVKLKKESISLVVRSAYIPKGQQFTMLDLSDGPYKIVAKDLTSGCNFRTKEFNLGAQHSTVAYTIEHNTANLEHIPEADFR